jgi:polysaccharide pyruvyl transferase WcaK-like protein
MRLRLLVFGGWYGSGNVGDDAILLGVRSLFSRVAPATKIMALSTDPAQTRSICGVDSVSIRSPREYLLRDYGGVFRDVDAVLVTGGTPFYDWDHMSRFIHMGVARRGVPFACFGVGAKKIESHLGRWLTRILLSGPVRVSARDAVSQRRLSALSRSVVSLTGDSALCMESTQSSGAKAVMESIGVEDGDPMVVVCPRALSPLNRAHYHDPISASLIASIRRRTASLVDELLNEGYRVVFLPMHGAANDDDVCEIGAIKAQMKSTPYIIPEPLPPHATATLLGSASLVIGFRLHSLILAACRGVPVVGVGYDEKILGFMEYAGVPDCVVEPAGLHSKAFKLLRGDGVGELLRDSCIQMRKRVEAEAVLVAESLGLR